MTKKLSLNHKNEWRFDDPQISRVRRILNKSEVLDSLESSLEFLELLREKNIRYDDPIWIVTDNAYCIHLNKKLEEGIDVYQFTQRYYKLFRDPDKSCNVRREGERFEGEFRYNKR